jgi:AraC-like DNA-binding protein
MFDPASDGVTNICAPARLLRAYSSLPFIAYVPLTIDAMRAVAELAKFGLGEVILARVNDSAIELREIVEGVSTSPLTTEFLDRLRPSLSHLPCSIVHAFEDLFRYPHKYASAQDLAVAASTTVSCLYHSFQGTGLPSPKRLLIAARLLRGYRYLVEQRLSVREVAVRVGYHHTRLFAEHTVAVFGLGPSKLRMQTCAATTLVRLERWVSDPASPVGSLENAQSSES